ncbi:MAG: CRTAC1 family protein [Haloarculaceae archaeon]
MELPTGGKRVALLAAVLVVLSSVAAGAVAVFGPQAETADISFEEVAEERGLDYEYQGHQVVNGNAGVYVADYDRDGRQDLLLVGNESRGPVLYRNTGGAFEQSGAVPDAVDDHRIHSALFFDYDSDGWQDLLLLTDPSEPSGGYTSGGGMATIPNASHPLLLENENGTYGDVRTLDNVPLQPYPIGATAADYNRDGCTDLFVYHNGDWSLKTPTGYRNPSTVGNITDDNGEPNYLLRGNCRGNFTRVGDEAGIRGTRWSLVASFVDFTGDGLPDIHVANDFNEDVLYVNEGDGTFDFRRMGDSTDRNAMSSEVADFNGDRLLDVFVTQIGMASRDGSDVSADKGSAFRRQAAAQSPRYAKGNQLLVNQGNGTFVDRAPAYNVKRAPFVWGWAAVATDLDNDGDLDIVHANNEKSAVTSEGDRVMMRWRDTPPGAWENVGNATHPSYTSLQANAVGLVDMNARGMVRIDYDNDGDLDVVAADEANQVKLFENRVTTGHWLEVELVDESDHRTLGADVYVTVDDTTYRRTRNARVDFLSQESRRIHVGLGSHGTVDEIRVVWPDGTTHRYTDVEADRRITLTKSGEIRDSSG